MAKAADKLQGSHDGCLRGQHGAVSCNPSPTGERFWPEQVLKRYRQCLLRVKIGQQRRKNVWSKLLQVETDSRVEELLGSWVAR